MVSFKKKTVLRKLLTAANGCQRLLTPSSVCVSSTHFWGINVCLYSSKKNNNKKAELTAVPCGLKVETSSPTESANTRSSSTWRSASQYLARAGKAAPPWANIWGRSLLLVLFHFGRGEGRGGGSCWVSPDTLISPHTHTHILPQSWKIATGRYSSG